MLHNVEWLGVELMTSLVASQCLNYYTTRPHITIHYYNNHFLSL